MTLAELPIGRPARVAGFKSLGEEERLRLSALGLREDTVVTKLLRTPLRDPVVCLAGPQLLAIEAWLLASIEVESEQEASGGTPALSPLRGKGFRIRGDMKGDHSSPEIPVRTGDE